jgi:hypothetical protein
MKSSNISATLNAYLPNNTRSYRLETYTCKYLQVKTTNLLALYTMSILFEHISAASQKPQDQREGNSIYDGN